MARKKSKKSKDKETLCNNVPDLAKIAQGAARYPEKTISPAPPVHREMAEEMKVGTGELMEDGGLFKAIGRGDTVGSLKDNLAQSSYASFLTMVPVDKDDGITITLPVISSHGDFSIQLTRHALGSTVDTSEGLHNSIERFITQSITREAKDHPKVSIPVDFTETEIFHRVLRDASNRQPNEFAVAMSTKDSEILLRMENAVKDVVDYSANNPTSYAGIPIIPSRFINSGDMYIMSKDTNFLAFKDVDIKTEGRILAGAGFTPDALIYEAVEDCHTVWYEFSDETNDFCIECETCGYSYWAASEDDAIERLNAHTEDNIFIKTFRGR